MSGGGNSQGKRTTEPAADPAVPEDFLSYLFNTSSPGERSPSSKDTNPSVTAQGSRVNTEAEVIARVEVLKVLYVAASEAHNDLKREGFGSALSIDLSRKLSSNHNHELPEEAVDFLQGVERLALSHNQLSSLPNRISELSSLRYLNLRANNIEEFPMSLCDLKSLEILDLSRNHLRALPNEIGKILTLKILNVQHNQIQSLNRSLGYMSSMQVLLFKENPMTFPPKSIIDPQVDKPHIEHDPGDKTLQEVSLTKQIQRFLRIHSDGTTASIWLQNHASGTETVRTLDFNREAWPLLHTDGNTRFCLNSSAVPTDSTHPLASYERYQHAASGSRSSEEHPFRWVELTKSPDTEVPTREGHLEPEVEDSSTVGDSVDVRSEIESIFSTDSLRSSNSSLGNTFSAAISEWARVLLSEDELVLLYPEALAVVGSERFRRNFARFLKTYSQKLEKEATNEAQHKAAKFARQSAKQTASEIARILASYGTEELELWHLEIEKSNLERLNYWLESLGGEFNATADDDRASLSGGSESDEDDGNDVTSLRALEHVKEFMISAKAFIEFRHEFRRWLKLDDEQKEEELEKLPKDAAETIDDAQEEALEVSKAQEDPGQGSESPVTQTDIPIHRRVNDAMVLQAKAYECIRSGNIRVWARLRFQIMDFLYPSTEGYRRFPYLCGCGELVYLDLKEVKPGGIERFWQRLNASLVRGEGQSSTWVPTAPPGAYMRPDMQANPARTGATEPDTQQHRPSPFSPSPQGGNNAPTVAMLQNVEPQFLLLCINTRSLMTLAHVEVGSLTSDQYLFQEISKAYKGTKESHQWSIPMMLPSWYRKLYKKVSNRLPKFGILPDWANIFSLLDRVYSTAQLYRIASGDFVRFHLIPVGTRCSPTWFKAPELPPEAEVAARRYLYQPVPMDDIEVKEIPLAHLLKPEPHHDMFWLTTFPKKLSEELRRPAGTTQRVVGWGIRINEELNWATLLIGMLTGIIGISIIVIVYCAITADDSSAFGLGAYLAALFTIYVTYQYISWKDAT